MSSDTAHLTDGVVMGKITDQINAVYQAYDEQFGGSLKNSMRIARTLAGDDPGKMVVADAVKTAMFQRDMEVSTIKCKAHKEALPELPMTIDLGNGVVVLLAAPLQQAVRFVDPVTGNESIGTRPFKDPGEFMLSFQVRWFIDGIEQDFGDGIWCIHNPIVTVLDPAGDVVIEKYNDETGIVEEHRRREDLQEALREMVATRFRRPDRGL